MAKKEIKFPKKREALLRYHHGENWTEEDQDKFVRERNTRHCRNYRNNHREECRDYQKESQRKFRKKNLYYYGWKQYSKKHKGITYEQYIAYRQQKERKKKQKKNL